MGSGGSRAERYYLRRADEARQLHVHVPSDERAHCDEDVLAEGQQEVDGFAPEVAPGIVDESVPGGLSLENAEAIIRATADRFRIRAATLAAYTPELDEDEKTLRVGLSIIELLAEYASKKTD